MTQARGAARREEIVLAAAEEFDELGYAASSLSSIAARLDRTKGAMSYHFSAKEQLARELVVRHNGQWDEVLDRIRADGLIGLEAMVLLSFIVATRFRDDVLVRAAVRLQHDAGLRDVDLPTPFVGWTKITLDLLTEAGASVTLPSGLDLPGAAEVLVEAFTGLQQVAHRLTGARDIHARVERYWLLVLPGLGVADPKQLVTRLRAESQRY
ncbi:hypothetical protein GCM10027414_13820 [Humibacter ginsengiterrae]